MSWDEDIGEIKLRRENQRFGLSGEADLCSSGLRKLASSWGENWETRAAAFTSSMNLSAMQIFGIVAGGNSPSANVDCRLRSSESDSSEFGGGGGYGEQEGGEGGDQVGTRILNGEERTGDKESYVLEFPLL